MIEQIEKEIHLIAKDYFSSDLVEDFISKFKSLALKEIPLAYFLQISTDQGYELELGFFTKTRITDVTLSNEKIYFYFYPLASIRQIEITDSILKTTLTIHGEKKFDYNVVKPASILDLEKYENCLRMNAAVSRGQRALRKQDGKINEKKIFN